MADRITIRTDAETERTLEILTRDGLSRAAAIQQAVLEGARRKQRAAAMRRAVLRMPLGELDGIDVYDPADLPDDLLITAVTLGELSHGPHATEDPGKRASRMAVLQHVESAFDPLPYDREAARIYGQMCAAVIAMGRQPRGRSSDLMIAATAAANGLPLYTSNPKDFAGLDGLVEIVAVTRPAGV